MSASLELLDKVVDLVNKAKVEAKEQKINLLAQVREICFNRDSSLLEEVIPMVAEFQTDFNANCRKWVASFLREVVRSHPQHVGMVVPVASFLMHDSNTNVKKTAVLLANTTYRPALQRLVDNGSMEGAQQDWSVLEGLRKAVLNTITSGPADISMVAVKFAESVVLACVGGRGLAPGASREGDKSVQRSLSPSHPFLLADTLDQAGHALARQMLGWLGSCGGGASGAPGAKDGTGWGLGFGAQHYTVLISALQNLATNRAALFADIVPVLATALESVNVGGKADGRGSEQKKTTAPKGLQDAASSLRSACLRLLKVAPMASKSVQRLATAAALSGSDGEAKAAVDGNSNLRGRIKLPARPRERPKTSRADSLPPPPPPRIMALTTDNRRDLAALASSASLGKMPKPPPGYKQNRTKGFPLPDLSTLFGHVLNVLGPEIATAKNQPPSEGSGANGGESVGSKRARDSAADEGGGKRRSGSDTSAGAKSDGASSEQGKSPMEVDTAGSNGGSKSKENKPGAAVDSQAVPVSAPPWDPVQEGLVVSKKAFSRVLGVWEGVAMEGKTGLHQRVVARLGRILAEAEAAALAQDSKASESEMVVVEAMGFMAKDYKKRFQAALALLTDMYVADVAAAAAAAAAAQAAKQEKGKSIKRTVKLPKPRGFDLYDEALLSLLTTLSGSLEATWRQKLFTQTLLECPRVPPAALELVCTLCDMAARPQDVQTGLVALKDLIFHKPATRNVCIPSVLRFTYHSDNDVRTKAVRLAANLLWKDPAFQPVIETFARQALASVQLPEEKKVEKKEEEVKPPSPPRLKVETTEEDLVDFEGDDEEEEEGGEEAAHRKEGSPAAPPSKAPAPTPPVAAAPAAVNVVGPWLAPPETAATARVRLSLYFALCVKSRPMLSGLLAAYVTATPETKEGLKAELPLLARAAAKGFGEAGVVGLVAAAPVRAKALVLVILDLLVPREINKPSPELVAAVRHLKDTRLTNAVEEEGGEEGGDVKEKIKEAEVKRPSGIEYIVPILGGVGREGVIAELPALLEAKDDVIRAAIRRLTQPAKGATYTPAELVVLLNQSDARVPIKNQTRALTLCLENKAVYNYPVLREALNVMSQVPAADQQGGGSKEIPLLLMRTVLESVQRFPELKNFVATVVLVRLVQHKVWTSDGLWKGFLRCARMMAKESGATSFIAMVQLPDKKLKEALAHPLMKGVKEPLRRYAQTLVKVDPGVRAVLGIDNGTRETSS
eukprot:g14174.t1